MTKKPGNDAVAEVDASMTRTYGDVYMHVSEFEYFVEGTPPPPDLNAIEQTLAARKEQFGRLLPANVDGAIAAISADLGFSYELGNAIFLISRLPGLIAHAHEERTRQQPMRQIDPKDHVYDGSSERRLPEGRK